ncbi:nucleoside triphosphate pyrophosphohydrolase [Tahibacter amnicola]|uniref:Nucleoside triphosphate pyrophosphohydrolase n=1 Tax=Tahibacter amnicola TaxID=2976241 RepID=A0ABY6BI70_9GAMM|nr:nucleoside triphosphate pyrophosphohydrolase [Tahibacter amnicola]UXI67557.1 nucleoside triphosphate pyrophosphohydrolase [Tahibacter amnicola]
MHTIDDLLRIMATLRNPDGGCPWDVQQDFDTIAPYTIEEAYEVADAIDRRDYSQLCDELGDLLFQVVFHARMAEEAGHFRFADVVEAICTKMVRRHPHVFAGAEVADAQAQTRAWESHKRAEREARGESDNSLLAGISRGMPEWQRARKLQARAATVGFDWPDVAPVFDKLHEEIDEVRAEFAGGDAERLNDEIGDLLFVSVNIARHAKVDVSRALRSANAKFERRFRRMEQLAVDAGGLKGMTLAQQDALWDRAKAEEKSAATEI